MATRAAVDRCATYSHHSAQRLKTARIGEWGREQNTAAIQKTPTPQPELFSPFYEESCLAFQAFSQDRDRRPCDHAVCFPAVHSYVYCAAIQLLDRVPDIPVVPQKVDSTAQSLNKVVDAGCAGQLPMVQTVLQLRSPTRSSTSLFSRPEQEVPQIQSSTEFNDNLEAGLAHFFLTPPRVRGFFEPSMVKSSSSSRAHWVGGVAGSRTPR